MSTMISVGRWVSRLKAANARATVSRSLASPTRVTFQQCPTNFATSSENARLVAPSGDTAQLDSFRWAANEAASAEIPSVMSPSPPSA
jgi:hypothetical protein